MHALDAHILKLEFILAFQMRHWIVNTQQWVSLLDKEKVVFFFIIFYCKRRIVLSMRYLFPLSKYLSAQNLKSNKSQVHLIFFSTINDQNSELKISVHAGSRQPLKKNDLDVKQPQSSIISNKLLETLKPWMSLSTTETCQACISHA